MPVPAPLLATLIDDAALLLPGADAAVAVAAHLSHRDAWFAEMIGPLVVPDQRLSEVGRASGSANGQGDLPVSVVNSAGAGGLVSLAGRRLAGVRVVAVASALRDLDDLARNAARVASAATELSDEVRVFVEIPYAYGWERAVEAVEAAGLLGQIRVGGSDGANAPSTDQLARQLSVLVEADLPFRLTGPLGALPTPGRSPAHPRQHGLLTLLRAVEALVEGASDAEAAQLLAHPEPTVVAVIQEWSDAHAARVRRRLLAVGSGDVRELVEDLSAQAGFLPHVAHRPRP